MQYAHETESNEFKYDMTKQKLDASAVLEVQKGSDEEAPPSGKTFVT